MDPRYQSKSGSEFNLFFGFDSEILRRREIGNLVLSLSRFSEELVRDWRFSLSLSLCSFFPNAFVNALFHFSKTVISGLRPHFLPISRVSSRSPRRRGIIARERETRPIRFERNLKRARLDLEQAIFQQLVHCTLTFPTLSGRETNGRSPLARVHHPPIRLHVPITSALGVHAGFVWCTATYHGSIAARLNRPKEEDRK